jgi:hypothetical protein
MDCDMEAIWYGWQYVNDYNEVIYSRQHVLNEDGKPACGAKCPEGLDLAEDDGKGKCKRCTAIRNKRK